jgi:hypothetical protein
MPATICHECGQPIAAGDVVTLQVDLEDTSNVLTIPTTTLNLHREHALQVVTALTRGRAARADALEVLEELAVLARGQWRAEYMRSHVLPVSQAEV